MYVENSESTIGSVYKKAVYRQYTSADFTKQVPQPPTQGLLGPTLHAEVGDKLVVVLRNALSLNTSLLIGGGLLPASADMKNAVLQPNQTYTYEWIVPASAAPGPQDPTTVAYSYYSGVDTAAQLNAGLMGALVVANPGTLQANDLAKGLDHEVTLMFHVSNENDSPYLEDNVNATAAAIGQAFNVTSEDFEESNLMHGINGFLYCNMPAATFARKSTVRWVVLGMGSQEDIHSPVFTGQVVTQAGRPVYSPGVLPAMTQVVDMVAASPGTWQYYCFVFDHMVAGMMAKMVVQ